MSAARRGLVSSLRAAVGGRASIDLPGRTDVGGIVTSAHDVRLELGGNPVLTGASLDVRAGEVRALVGPNGAGKSTLLSVLTGDRTPSSGRVVVDGRDLTTWTTRELALRRAVLTQDVTVSFPFTVREVVEMGRSPWRGTPAEVEDDDAVATSLAATDVAHLADRRFTTLSGGERARAALARVLAQRTQLLLLDEPTAALDLRHQEIVLTLAREHARAGGAIVVVVHDIGLAAAYADQVTVLARGHVVGDGPARDVLTSALLSDVYEHPVEVLEHPGGGAPIILPRR